jgi:hypothetical protein
VVYDSLSSWNVGNYDPVASLAYSVSRDTLTFNSTSTYTDSVYIDFGDGNGTSDPCGQHSYGLDDFFTVTLYAFRCDRSDTLEVQVQSIIIFGMDEPALEPLPSLESLAQEWPENLQRVELFNLQGQLLWTGTKQQRGPLPRNDHQTWVLRYNYENGTYRSAVGSK